jgi:hypothetical protein
MEISISQKDIQYRIFTIRGLQVIVDRDLAALYGVETKVLNQAVKRNLNRFPSTFRFQLTNNEVLELVTNCDRFENLKHSSVLPFAFTEQGVAMVSAILKSDIAVQVSIQIMETFVQLRQMITSNMGLIQRLDALERKQIVSDNKFDQLFEALESGNLKPSKGIFYDGQIFDAYEFVCEIIRRANSSIIIIDNYMDESVLKLLTKRKEGVKVQLLMKKISPSFELDIQKYNAQYPTIEAHSFIDSHDRFILIDQIELYHIGASLKDLGKKWFAFSRMPTFANSVFEKIKLIVEL